MQLTQDSRTEVYVQFVAAYVPEPICSCMILRSNGVNLDLSRPDHAILPNGAKVPMEQDFTYLYFRIYRCMPAKQVEYKNNMLTFSIHAEKPSQACPTYSKSTLGRTTGGNTDYWEFYHQSNTHRRVHICQRRARSVPTSKTIPTSTPLAWSILRGRLQSHIQAVQRYRRY